jgi:hypothetical protein
MLTGVESSHAVPAGFAAALFKVKHFDLTRSGVVSLWSSVNFQEDIVDIVE